MGLFAGFAGLALVWLSFGLIFGGLMFDFAAEFWLSFLKNQTVELPFWLSMIGGCILSPVLLPVWFFTLLFSMVM